MYDPEYNKKKKPKGQKEKYSFKCGCGIVETDKGNVYARTSKGIVCQTCFMDLVAKRRLGW